MGWGGREAREGRDMYTSGLPMLIYGRNQHNIVIILQLKINKLKKKKKWRFESQLHFVLAMGCRLVKVTVGVSPSAPTELASGASERQ